MSESAFSVAQPAPAQIKIDGGTVEAAPTAGAAKAKLGVAGPSFALWTRNGFAKPARFGIFANYAAYIDRWELSFYRIGDHTLSKPLRVFTGGPDALFTGVLWDGRQSGGDALRPGERVIYVLRVFDADRNMDETKPRELLITRYASKKQTRDWSREETARRDALIDGAPLAHAAIPTFGSPVLFSAHGIKGETTVGGMPLRPKAAVEQILPFGSYSAQVATADGRTARLSFLVGGPRARMAPLSAFAGPIEIAPAAPMTANADEHASPRFTLVGRAAGARLATLAAAPDAKARTLARQIDPAANYLIYRDADGRDYARIDIAASAALWPPASARAGAAVIWVKHSMEFPAPGARFESLGCTDINPASIVATLGDGTPLIFDRDYLVEPILGAFRLTPPGRARLSSTGPASRIRLSFHALDFQYPDRLASASGSNAAYTRNFGTGMIETGEISAKK